MTLKNNGLQSRRILGIFGWIEYSRTSLVPSDSVSKARLELEGINSVCPLDCALGVDRLPFKITCRMMCAIVKEAVRARSYSDAVVSIEEKYHVKLSSVYIEKITDYVGSLVFAEQMDLAKEAEKGLSLKVDGRHRRRRKNDILYLELDGAMVHIRDKKDGDGWMESKHAMAFHSADVHYYGGTDGEEEYHRISKQEYVGFIGSAADFEMHFLALAKRSGYDLCSEVVVISDGALWIHDIVEKYLPKATHILDLFHAKENAGKFAQAVKSGKNQKKQFADQLCDLIDAGNVAGLLKILEPYKDKKIPGIPNMYTYVENHKTCMNYPDYKKKGYFVGSGAMESGNIRLMQNRMKLQGMRWKLKTGQNMLSLKAKYESGRWQDVVDLMTTHCYA